jgi:hypothetical protein
MESDSQKTFTIKGLPAKEYYRMWKKENADKVRRQSLAGYHRNKESINRRVTLIRLKGGASIKPETLLKYGINPLDLFGPIDD